LWNAIRARGDACREDAIIFELRDDKRVSWREYLDTAGLKLP
jgi:limonene-1,2-epoxide hydrolase